MSKHAEFTIDLEGNLSIDKLEGYGDGCKDATELFERRLGVPDESTRKFTDEYHEAACVKSEGVRTS